MEFIHIIQKIFSKQINQDEHFFFIPLTGVYQTNNQINNILNCLLEQNSVNPADELLLAKTPKGIATMAINMQSLLIVTANQKDILWENEDLARARTITFFKVVDGHYILRKYGRKINLSGANLMGAYLMGADLSEANLSGVNLRGANLERACLHNANLSNSILEGANLYRANLNGANLTKADLRRANLRESDLRNIHSLKTAFRGAELWSAYLWGTDLSNAFTSGIDLSRADTRGN